VTACRASKSESLPRSHLAPAERPS
jgi:hypothetical protein